ncbi:flagellar hook protein FlgE [Mesobaculum littorinae]|uniref:Flagellar hook protein FlgE n=1 Tax=Mesobaculum littorinae TaxID=2486419 RepID=A0A438AGZ2_9RHOB|nr:flagellar hook protein FlgE [Mesobaculum littorinae]RVV97981.1 flagellar hook protein FlgE [Mesobaculum littorinae]
MSISSSLQAGVSGLNANATRLATISDNIANASTNGYKRNSAEFHSMVIGNNTAGQYTAGGVRATTATAISERGQLIGTGNSTDFAIAGRGFLPVTDIVAVNNESIELPFRLMTTGSFQPNDDGYLVNSAGMALMGWPANPDGTIPEMRRDTSQELEPVQVTHNQFAANPTRNVQLGLNLPASGTLSDADGDTLQISTEYFDNLGVSQTLDFTFTPDIPANGQSNTWTMVIADSSQGGAVVGEYELTFDTADGSGGTLEQVNVVSGPAYNADGTLDLALPTQAMTLAIGEIGDPNGLTQLEADFAPTTLSKDGSPVGNLLDVEINPNGVLYASYDNGFTRPIYRVPVVDVQNADGLNVHDGQTYSVSEESGPFFLWNAAEGPVGEVSGYTLENSTVDIAEELTTLIQTQRAYSSNAKIIQTVDEMMQETTNLKR